MNSLSMARCVSLSRVCHPLLLTERKCTLPTLQRITLRPVRPSVFLGIRGHIRFSYTIAGVRSHPSSHWPKNALQGKSTNEVKTEKVELTCPVCLQPLPSDWSKSSNLITVTGTSLRCSTCQRAYKSNGGIIDLTIPTDGSVALGSSFFEIPLIAYVYERGYRDQFGFFGFPGFNEEAKMARNLLAPARGEVLLDLSCGPGGFTRSFLATGDFDTVIAADFSQAMLEQCCEFLEKDESTDLSRVILVKADAARLPFATSSLAGVHAAAAIHCWPDLFTSMTEISRVLRPGGVFIASTFIVPTPRSLEDFLKPLRQLIDRLQLTFSWFTEAELKATTEACGLINWYSYRRGPYIMFSVSKPS